MRSRAAIRGRKVGVVAHQQGQAHGEEEEQTVEDRESEVARQGAEEGVEPVGEDAGAQDPHGEEPVAVPHVLAHEDRHRLVLAELDAHRLPPAARSPEVDDLGGRHVVDPPARPAHAVAPVEVLPVHEVVLVEPPHLLQDAAAHDHARARQGVDLVGLLRVQVGEVVAREAAAAGEEAAEACELPERRRGRGEAAPAVELQAAVGVEDPAPRGARLGVLVHELHQGAEGVGAHDGVGVEEQDVPPLHPPEGDVVGAAEAEIAVVADQLRPGEPRLHHLGAAVPGGVVHDDHLHPQALGGLGHRAQGLLHQLPGVVAGDDDAQVRLGGGIAAGGLRIAHGAGGRHREPPVRPSRRRHPKTRTCLTKSRYSRQSSLLALYWRLRKTKGMERWER